MTRRTIKMWLVGLACAGIPLVTSATCNPQTGGFNFFRNDDSYYDDGYYYDDAYYVDYYDDCYFFDCF